MDPEDLAEPSIIRMATTPPTRDDFVREKQLRSKKYGIASYVGTPLTPPKGYPVDHELYGDPVNFQYPVHDAAHANNARVRFRQQKGRPYSDADKKTVYGRIIAAQLKFKSKPSFNPDDELDRMLPADMQKMMRSMSEDAPPEPPAESAPAVELATMSFEEPAPPAEQTEPPAAMAEATPEHEAMARMAHEIMAKADLEPKDRDFLMKAAQACSQGRDLPREDVQRLRGIAAAAGIDWPCVTKPLGMPAEEGHMPSMPMMGGMGRDILGKDIPVRSGYAEVDGHLAVVRFGSVADAETFNIPNVEIFATGTWHGEAWTEQHLDEIVQNFCRLQPQHRVPVKIGHSNQILEREDDSLPAVGWVENVRRAGNKIVADFVRVPRVVRDLIQQRAYSRVSSEIYLDYSDGTGASIGKVLRAVALLGSALPEVKCLQDVTLLYGASRQPPVMQAGEQHRKWVMFSDNDTGGSIVDEKELAELEQKLAAANKRAADAEAHNAALLRQKQEAEVTAFFTDMVQKGIFVPAQEQAVKQFLTALTSDQVRAFTSNGKTPFDMARDLFSTFRPVVQFGEQMPAAKPDIGATPGAPAPAPKPTEPPVVMFTDGLDRQYRVTGVDIMQKVREFRKQHPHVSIEDAVIAVQRADDKGSWLL